MYIEREKAIEALTGWETDPTDEDIEYVLTKEVPAADVVEVVRCKDCKHLLKDNTIREYHLCMRIPFGCQRRTDLMDFCSYGERK